MLQIHELNGCIVGPGLYQEWTHFVYAARHSNEQNLELCRSLSNNMFYYRATRPIRKGEQLLAWYSCGVESELFRSSLFILSQANEEIKALNVLLESTIGGFNEFFEINSLKNFQNFKISSTLKIPNVNVVSLILSIQTF